ncbi:hypothetical protein [Pseudomonas sp. OHS18]|uniref:hypothetical protein n=1 Tax=Pseudomonas sp. OHS18 TaxID=3399679 RepID=UPI003A865F1C
MDTSDPKISFSDTGHCEYCENFGTSIEPNWHPDARGEAELAALAAKIKKQGEGKDFDCIIGLSGGLDSSYAAYIAKEKMGLRPLLFHVDAGWNTDQAVGNIEKLVDGLGLDLYTEVINWEEMKDLQVAFLRSQIADQDLPQDAAFSPACTNSPASTESSTCSLAAITRPSAAASLKSGAGIRVSTRPCSRIFTNALANARSRLFPWSIS